MNSENFNESKKADISVNNESTKSPRLILIAAIDENNVLGKNNKLIWHLPEDLKRFKRLTSSHAIIMGRKTFESLPRALPNRLNIVITRNMSFYKEGINICHSLESAIECGKFYEKIFVIGGGQVYKQAIELADEIELTKIHAKFDGDVFFPKIDPKKWSVEKEVQMSHSDFEYSFITYYKI